MKYLKYLVLGTLFGIILTKNKDELLVEYATYEMNSQLFVQNTNSTCPTSKRCATGWR